jgi:hypothetical protein
MLAVLTLSPASGHAGAPPPAHTSATDAAFVARMLFTTSLTTFSADAVARVGADGRPGDRWFDWSTDFCSAPLVGNTGRTFNFTEPCRRHDFGYRNLKLLDQRYGRGTFWNSVDRYMVDLNFLTDMRHHCASRRLIDHPTCYAWALTFYSAVRAFGGL